MIDDLVLEILGKLQMLAEGATVNLDPNRVHSSATKSKPPAGVGLRGDTDHPPDKDRVSLYEYYSWHFAKAQAEGDDERLRSLYLVAQVDYVDYRFRTPKRVALRKGEAYDRDVDDPEAVERRAAEDIVELYEGRPAHFVATVERVHIAWVRKARRWNDRNPEDGRRLPEFRLWDEERRTSEVQALQALDFGAQTIALKLGTSKRTVQRYMRERDPVAA